MTNLTSILKYHSKKKGKIGISVLAPIKNKKDLSLAYTPGVAEVSKIIAAKKEKVLDYTIKSHTVAIVTDGSAVLGLGNIGPEAALPVMEGKAALFKTFADIDAFPICLDSQDVTEIVNTVKLLTPVFGGVNLEDISAPRCFEVEEKLQSIGIPVMHDDQHGTAVVVLAGLINAAKVVDKNIKKIRVVVNGAGAAGNAIASLLSEIVADVIVVDSKGIIDRKRKDLDPYKKKLSKITNKENRSGGINEALTQSDVFVGVSKGGLLASEHIKLMNRKAIVFALANPVPEIMPKDAYKGGAMVVATGRSDLPNQINNSLAFPGIFKGALAVRAKAITKKMKIAAAHGLAGLVKKPTAKKIIPGPFDKGVVNAVSDAVTKNV